MAATVKVVRLERTWKDQIYLLEVLRGLGLTLKHMFVNMWGRRATPTIQYPEQTIEYPKRFRGVHRLMQRDDGRVRCVACMMCSTACPARCIHIEAAETDDPSIEKYPAVFAIDELKCVDCGLCVEACPCDSIRMDTGLHMPPVLTRGAAVLGKIDLLKLAAPSVATQGGEKPGWQSKPDDPRFADR
ncbi:MAG: NADH-quinone oxidoreductase subunit I [Myxococcota bacterium]